VLDIDVFVPLYNASNYMDRLIRGISSQKKVNINKIVFGVTDSFDGTLEIAKKVNGAIIFQVSKESFSHSLIREKGMSLCSSPIVIFLSQDVVLSDENAFFELAKSIRLNNIAYAFGRQITLSKGIEKYVREKNFPSSSYIVQFSDIQRMQIKAFYSSDAFAAYDREVFTDLGGYDNKRIIVSEDMYYCKKCLFNGYNIAYISSAVVTHSHNLSLKQLYKRYYDIGVFFKDNPEFKRYKSVNSGISLASYVLKRALQEANLKVLFRLIPDMFTRYIAKKRGERSHGH
jgi:rhamnosyltransferase